MASLGLALALCIFLIPYARSYRPGHRLAVRWEGLFIDLNVRDFGASFNECYGKKVIVEGRLFRAAQWFSGWSCSRVGNPEVMYSLNSSPNGTPEYFCNSNEGSKIIGRHFVRHRQLSDLEFMENWADASVRDDFCPYLSDSFNEISNGTKVLFHCDAGRDRTGLIAAVILGLTLERAGRFDNPSLEAIECDYRKSKSLVPAKYGRMSAFLEAVKAKGGIGAFISAQCNLDPNLIARAADRLLSASQ